jgi:threonine/homoserine/homoserine lactone efflux protein
MTGFKVSLGHVIVELFLVLLIPIGLASVALPYISDCRNWRDCADVFGAPTIKGSRKATMRTTSTQTVANPYVAGFVTSAVNPYF